MSKQLELRRELGLGVAVAIVIGTVIGSGIFLVPKTMVLAVSSPWMVLGVFLFGGFLSLAGALTYAELAAAMPEAGGEYVYLREAYGPFWGFIYGWTQLWVAKSGSLATLATAFFYYLANFYPVLEQVWVTLPFGVEVRYGQICAMGVIALLAAVNYAGVKVSGGTQVVVTVVKVACIAAIVLVGLFSGSGSMSNLETSVPAPGGILGFFAALVAALWAYDGWNNVAMVSSEIKNPEKNLPVSLILGTLAVMAIYMLACFSYFYVLPASEVAGSDRVAAQMMRKIFGPAAGGLVSVAAMISIFAAINGSILSGARVPFAMARDGRFFAGVGKIHPVYRTPSVSIVLLCSWAMVLVLSGKYDELFSFVIFGSWILYGMATASVIVLRRKRPDMPRPYKALGYPFVPVVFVLVAMCLLGSELFQHPGRAISGLGIMALGIPFYAYWNRRMR